MLYQDAGTIRKPTPDEALLGWDRYETVRRLTPRAFAELTTVSLSGLKPFDQLVDELRGFVRPTASRLVDMK